jgi:endonuclease III
MFPFNVLSDIVLSSSMTKQWVGEMTQRLREHADLLEDLSSVPNTKVGQLITACYYLQVDPMTLASASACAPVAQNIHSGMTFSH